MSIRTEIAIAVKNHLDVGVNAGLFGNDVVTLRAYVPIRDLQSQTHTYMTVIGRSFEPAPVARGYHQREVGIDVAVQKKIAASPGSESYINEIDDMGDVVEAVINHFEDKPLSDIPQLKCSAVSNNPIYVYEALRDAGMFVSVVRLTYVAHVRSEA